MSKILCISLLFLSSLSLAQICPGCRSMNFLEQFKASDDSRSDSLDVLHTHLEFDFTDFSSMILKGKAQIDFRAKLDNIEHVNLDLLSLEVDSALMDDNSLVFSQSGELLTISLDSPLNQGDEFSLTVYYGGSAQVDDSGWGGFYWTPTFAYNLGVGFDADPHNYGRAWFPCFDNFKERCTFSVNILSADGKRGISNGDLIEETLTEEGHTLTKWNLDMEIPSYLASIAVAEYDYNTSSYVSITEDEIPVWLIAPSNNVNNVNASFTHLNDALLAFEETYGPYEWTKVGYVFVPFSSGAMEHATNIAYPISFASGDLNFETLMAHELAHHWWGDLVTCSSAEDMWINEGMASFSEGLFLEHLYGSEAYYEWVSDNHRNVLLNAHSDDNGYLPVSGIGHSNTYGSHVYNKGASVGNCLRSYMGNEDFAEACANFMAEFALKDASSQDMRDYFQSYTDADLNSFFDNWVFNPGFTAFTLDNHSSAANGDSFDVDMEISQRLHEAPDYFMNVPIVATFISENGDEVDRTVVISGDVSMVSANIPFEPEHIILNRGYELTPGILAEEKFIGDTVIDNFSYAEFRSDIDVLAEGDTIWMRVECHFTGPDISTPQVEYEMSSDRFWRVIGDFPEDAVATARIRYYGDPSGLFDFDTEFFDQMELAGFDENDIVLFYRPDGSTPWQIHSNFEVNIQGDEGDFSGRIDFQNLKPGDYVWGYETGETLIQESQKEISVFPNPATNSITLNLSSPSDKIVKVYNELGAEVYHSQVQSSLIEIITEQWPSGAYTIQVISTPTNELINTLSFVKLKE